VTALSVGPVAVGERCVAIEGKSGLVGALLPGAGLVLENFAKFFKFSSHQIFRHMHEALNIDKKIKLITQFRRNGRYESFKSN
jgi:hypothetical protein